MFAGLGGLIYLGPTLYRHFGKRYEHARTEIFEENLAYKRGTIEHLNRLRLEYRTAEEKHREVLRQTILTTVASFDRSKLPYDLNQFIRTLEK